METSANARNSKKILLFFALTFLAPCLAFGQLKVNVRVRGSSITYHIQKSELGDTILLDRTRSVSILYRLVGGRLKLSDKVQPFEEPYAHVARHYVDFPPGVTGHRAEVFGRDSLLRGEIIFVRHLYRYHYKPDPKGPFVPATYEAVECIRAE